MWYCTCGTVHVALYKFKKVYKYNISCEQTQISFAASDDDVSDDDVSDVLIDTLLAAGKTSNAFLTVVEL